MQLGQPTAPPRTLFGQLHLDAREPKRFRQSTLGTALGEARSFYVAALESVRHSGMQQQFRTHCRDDQGADGGTEAVAMITDQRNVVRAFVLFGGTGDHYAEVRYFFDERQRLRLLFVGYADVAGGTAEHLVFLRPSGELAVCDDLYGGAPGLARWALCSDDDPPPRLDPEVARVLKDTAPHRPRNRQRESFLAVDPRAELANCTTLVVE